VRKTTFDRVSKSIFLFVDILYYLINQLFSVEFSVKLKRSSFSPFLEIFF